MCSGHSRCSIIITMCTADGEHRDWVACLHVCVLSVGVVYKYLQESAGVHVCMCVHNEHVRTPGWRCWFCILCLLTCYSLVKIKKGLYPKSMLLWFFCRINTMVIAKQRLLWNVLMSGASQLGTKPLYCFFVGLFTCSFVHVVDLFHYNKYIHFVLHSFTHFFTHSFAYILIDNLLYSFISSLNICFFTESVFLSCIHQQIIYSMWPLILSSAHSFIP